MLCEADLLYMNSVLIILAKLSEAYGLLYMNSVLIILCQIILSLWSPLLCEFSANSHVPNIFHKIPMALSLIFSFARGALRRGGSWGCSIQWRSAIDFDLLRPIQGHLTLPSCSVANPAICWSTLVI